MMRDTVQGAELASSLVSPRKERQSVHLETTASLFYYFFLSPRTFDTVKYLN